MSKKVSAFQVYSEDQRHPRSYRHPAGRSQSQANKYESPPHRSGRTASVDWREDVKMDSRVQERRSSSPEVRRDRSYDYDKYDTRRDDSSLVRDSRYGEDIRQNDSRDRQNVQTRCRSDDQYDRRSWERDNRRNDYTANTRDRSGHIHKDDYLPTLDASREVPSKGVRSGVQYTDSDEECLHESLRRKKQQGDRFRVEDDRQWSTDDDYSDYRQARKRALSANTYRSPSPEAVKDWRDSRHFSPQQGGQCTRTYADAGEDSDRGRAAAPPVKKKKIKGSKKSSKGKDKKHKAVLQNSTTVPSTKIQSLMDVKIPSSVKKQVEQNTASTTSLPRFGESRTDFKFGHHIEDTGRSFTRSQGDDRNTSRYDDNNRTCVRYDDDYQDHRREPAFGHRESESDRKGHRPHKESYSSRRSPDHDHRTYQQSDDDYDRGRDRQHRTSFSRDGRNNTEVVGGKRKRQSSMDCRDWPRTGNRTGQPGRSSEHGDCTDSDQDSDRGGRRSWRDERRDRQPKKKDEDREKGQKGEKKSKSKQELSSKNCQRVKKSSAGRKEGHLDQEPSARMVMQPCKEGVAVFLTHPQKICLRGRARLQVLAGEASLMGYTMEVKGSRVYDLFSPSTCSLLTISTCSAEKEKKPLRKAVQALGVEEKSVKEFMTGAVILLATKLDCAAADYICTHPPFTQLFRFNFDRVTNPLTAAANTPDPGKVGAAFLSVDQATTMYLKVSENFDEALRKWTSAVKSSKVGPVGLLCGGVNSGKSTFSRFMINSALRHVSKVCYLDCDVGQTEFSPPGTVALTIVDEPVFGPPFCHQKIAESMCFYGMVNPAEGPSRYIHCVEFVLKAYREMEHPPPLIVNTLGWNEGLGLKLFVDVLHLVSPDLVIQLNVATEVLNFPAITPQFVAQESGWLYNTEPVEEEEGEESSANKKKHEHVAMQSLVSTRNDPTRVKLTPKNMRDLALLAHLMQGFPPSVTLTSAVPFIVPWNRFAVHICHCQVPQRLIVDTLCASVVALCKADLSEAYRVSEDLPLFLEETPVCDCLGYGLVRAVDHKTQMLYMVTSLSPDQLSQVNTLLKGSITIPDQLLLKQPEESRFQCTLQGAGLVKGDKGDELLPMQRVPPLHVTDVVQGKGKGPYNLARVPSQNTVEEHSNFFKPKESRFQCTLQGAGLVKGDKGDELLPMQRVPPLHVTDVVQGKGKGPYNLARVPSQNTVEEHSNFFKGHMEDVPYIDALEPAMALAPVRPRNRMPRRN